MVPFCRMEINEDKDGIRLMAMAGDGFRSRRRMWEGDDGRLRVGQAPSVCLALAQRLPVG